MRGALGELLLPAERRIPSDDLVILSEAKSDGVFVGIADLVELLDAEVVVAGSEDQLEGDLFFEERRKDVEVSCDSA